MLIGMGLILPQLLPRTGNRSTRAQVVNVYPRPVPGDDGRVKLVMAFQYAFRDPHYGDAVAIGNALCDRQGNPLPHQVVHRSEAPDMIDRILTERWEGTAYYDPADPCRSARLALDENGRTTVVWSDSLVFRLGIVMVMVPPGVWLLVMLLRLLVVDQRGRRA